MNARAIILNVLWIPLSLQDAALMAIAVPAALLQLAPAAHVVALAALGSIASVGAMFVPPIAGWLSDRQRRAGGRRHSYVVAGVILDVACLIGLVFARDVVSFGALLVLAIVGANIAIAAYQAMLPEAIAREHWGIASGIRGAATLVGTVVGLAVAGFAPNPHATFVVTAVVLAIATFSLLWVPDAPFDAEERAQVNNWRDFGVVFVARALVFFGLSLLMTFVLFFFSDVFKSTNPSTATFFVAISGLLGAVVSSVVLGVASDRVPRRYVVALCGAPMAMAAAGFAIFPEPRAMYIFAVFFGVGFGGVISTGWALAMDTVPTFRDVARDLGLWGIATNLPNVIAPIAGGAILAAFHGTKPGYQIIFAVAALSFAAASLVVLLVGVGEGGPVAPLWLLPLRAAAIISNALYLHVAYRIRGWGRLPRRRGPTLVIANHQHDLEAMALVSRMSVQSSWRDAIFAITSRRLHEPGFFAVRIPWLRSVTRSYNPTALFFGIGMVPLENQLSTRSIASLGYCVQRRHGPKPLSEIFDARVSDQFTPDTTTADLWKRENFSTAQQPVRITMLFEPYRSEVIAETRASVEEDLDRLESILRRGGSVYLSPEGSYSLDGRIGRLRHSLERLAPHAKIYLAGVSYDPLVGGRLSMLYHLVPLVAYHSVTRELAAIRPVTVSQLLASWLSTRGERPFNVDEACEAVTAALRELPSAAFVDPELRRKPRTLVERALKALTGLKILEHDPRGNYRLCTLRRHPQFPRVDDIIAHQANFFAETIDALKPREPILVPAMESLP